MELISLLITSMLVENVVLIKYLGLCPFLAPASEDELAEAKIGLCLMIVMVLAALINYSLYNYVLKPFNIIEYKMLVFILVIASLVSIITLIVRKINKSLYEKFGLYLSLLTTNCAIYAVSLIVVGGNYSLIQTLIYAFGSGLGFLIVSALFGSLKRRLNNEWISPRMKGLPIIMITLSILSLVWSRFIIK